MKLALFHDRSGARIEHFPTDWDGLCAWLAAPPQVAEKAQAQLFSLCEFGDKRTERGSLRSNDNVLCVYGACGDYDGEKVQPEYAAERLAQAGVRAFVYTSPSHRADAPRWRVVLPFDAPGGVEDHASAVERLNGLIGGGLSSESFTLSQPFYIGHVAGHEFKSWRVEGVDIRGVDLPRVPWRGAQRADGGYRVDTATLVDELEHGQEVHPAIVSLAMRGFTTEELEDIVRRGVAAGQWERPERADVAIEADIPRAVESAARKREADIARKLAAIPPPPRQELPLRAKRLRLAADMLSEPKPVEWLVRGMIEHPTVAMLFGEPGAGKSFLALQWAACVATATEWNGRSVRRGPVVYVAGEGFNGLRRRVKAWTLHTGVSLVGAPFWISEKAIPITNTEQLQGLYEDIGELPERPALIVIDTLTRMTPGMDQNSPRDMGQFVGLCDAIKDAYGCTVLIIHHSGHGNKDRGKGAIDLKGALDVEAGLMRDGKGARLVSTKMKDGEEFDPMYFDFQTVELPWLENPAAGPDEPPRRQTSAVLIPRQGKPAGEAGSHEPADKIPQRRKLLVDVLRHAGKPLHSRDALDAFKQIHPGKPKTASNAFYDARRECREAGTIVWDEETDMLSLAFIQSQSTMPD